MLRLSALPTVSFSVTSVRSIHRPGLVTLNDAMPSAPVSALALSLIHISFHGFTDPGLEALADAYTTVYLGQFDKVIDYFRKHGVRRLCMAGAINKPRALDLRPDFRAARILFSLRGKGDDALLRAIMADLEKEGFTLIQAAELSTSLLCPEGVLTQMCIRDRASSTSCSTWRARASCSSASGSS